MNLRELAEAARETWPTEGDAVRAYVAACSPERVLALIDVAEAADGTPELKASSKSRWWREDGMAGSALADRRLRTALTRWRELSR